MFADYAKVYLEAGDGGDGCVSFRREKYVPLGGPDGGDGGKGGSIFFVVDPQITTLLDVKMHPHYIAKRGQHGMGNQCTGRNAEDVYVSVPQGTCISDEEGMLLADLSEPGEQWLAAAGGKGGKGNQHFATANNKAPRRWEYGGDGEKKTLVLELKLIADVGLVGLPNAGKSTLLGKLTAATPKIANYPFTTIHPNLGVLEFPDDEKRCVVADIPGLIEGAHHGAGLGHQFLRHIERTRTIVHLVAPPEEDSMPDFEHYWYAYELVNSELSAYTEDLANKHQIVALSKLDLLDPEAVELVVEGFKEKGIEPLVISSHTGDGIPELVQLIRSRLRQMDDEQAQAEADSNTGTIWDK